MTTKIVKIEGVSYLIPADVPSEEAASKGVPLSMNFADVYCESVNDRLIEELEARGLTTYEDVIAAAPERIRQALQAVLRLEVANIVQYAKKHVSE